MLFNLINAMINNLIIFFLIKKQVEKIKIVLLTQNETFLLKKDGRVTLLNFL